MDSLTEVFFDLVSDYGIVTAVSVTALLFLLKSFGISVAGRLKPLILRLFRIGRKGMGGGIELPDHTVFAEMDYLMNYRMKSINTGCVLRKHMYRDIMSENIRCTKESLLGFLKRDLEDMTPKELYLEVRTMFEENFDRTDENCIADGVPEFILSSMREKITLVWKFYSNQMKSYCYNEYLYQSNTERMCAIMDMVPTMLECYMNILERNLAEFNGDIKRLNYKGHVCANCLECIHDRYLKELKQEIEEEEEENRQREAKSRKPRKASSSERKPAARKPAAKKPAEDN